MVKISKGNKSSNAKDYGISEGRMGKGKLQSKRQEEFWLFGWQ
jgi:hypothetical protein